jgi:hypothetical protein
MGTSFLVSVEDVPLEEHCISFFMSLFEQVIAVDLLICE